MSRPARSYIARRGGDLYVYFTPLGDSPWMTQHATTRDPGDREFVRYDVEEIRVWLDAVFAPPASLQVRRRPWPLGPIEVTGTGAGETSLGGGGEGGWSWPSGDGGGGAGGHGGGGHGGH